MSKATVLLSIILSNTLASELPNVVLIVADDLGYNDVSWHNSDMKTPNLASLADRGIVLENYYVQPICSPTRAALMTGYYPIHTGRQHSVLWAQEPRGLFTNFTLMPDYFKKLGYKTHIIGKWHLGFCNQDYLPTRRGFDSFYGMYTGAQDYYKHTRATANNQGKPGYDFRRNDDVDFSANGKYSSYLFLNKSIEVIKQHALALSNVPFFIYLPLQDTHDPLQVPDKYTKLYPNVKDRNRRIFSGKVTALDDVVGGVVKTLEDYGLLNNTIIIFTSDNGGQVFAGGNNYPLRGNKATLWEGGTKAVGLIFWEKLKSSGQKFKGLMHVTDWIPTLMSAILGPAQSRSLIREKLDGTDVWESLISNKESPRKEMLYNFDPFFGDNKFGTGNRTKSVALRVGNMKLILGDPGLPDGWIPPPTNTRPKDLKSVIKNNEAFRDFVNFQHNKVRLYDLSDDPYEKINLVWQKTDLTKKLLQKLAWYESTMLPPDVAPEIPAGNPNRFGGVWSTGWCESRP